MLQDVQGATDDFIPGGGYNDLPLAMTPSYTPYDGRGVMTPYTPGYSRSGALSPIANVIFSPSGIDGAFTPMANHGGTSPLYSPSSPNHVTSPRLVVVAMF